MMTPQKRRWLAGALGTGLVLLLVVLASLDTLGDLGVPQRFVLTEVTAYQAPPPPPPPPPPSSRSDPRAGGSRGSQLALESRRTPVELDQMQLNVQFVAAQLGEVNLGKLGQGIGAGSGDGTGDGSGGYGLATLSELDQQPMVVSAPVFPYPDAAVAQGLTEFDLQFHILIDEEGVTYPLAVVRNPLPALNAEFLEFASKVRFTPPTRLGIPVRTEYLWPVKITRR
jgi:hypothetical protein